MLNIKEKFQKIDPKTKDILILLGAGTFLAASIVMPGLPLIASKILKGIDQERWKKSQKEWDKYNLWRLRQMIKRMHDAKYIEVKEINGVAVVKVAEKGKRKLLSYEIETMKLDEKTWDGKWRLIIYDVQTGKRSNSEMFRKALNRLNLYKLQKSVYLTPFKCEEEIEFLRQYYEVGKEVLILKAGTLEHESAYRKYFGI